MSKTKIAAISLLCLTLTILCIVSAYPVLAGNIPGRPPFLPGARAFIFMMRLDLSSRQEAEIARTLELNRDELMEMSRIVSRARLELFNRVHTLQPNEESIREACRAVAEAEEASAVGRAEVVADVLGVLDQDQLDLVRHAIASFNTGAAESSDFFWEQFDVWIQDRVRD